METQKEYRVIVTQKIIDKSNIYDNHNCIGTNCLRVIFGVIDNDIHWGSDFGYHNCNLFRSFDLNGNLINMMDITKPTTVIFKRID